MLKIHFLNVGHGDCTIIEHGSNRLTMIDINNGTELDSESRKELSESFGVVQPNPFFGGPPLNPFLYQPPGPRRPTTLLEAGYDIKLTNPVQFLRGLNPRDGIFRYIQSHPHLDHMRGVVGLREAQIDITNFWDTYWSQPPDFQSEADEDEWREYRELAEGRRGARVLRLARGANGIYYNEEPEGVSGGDGIEVLAPTSELMRLGKENGNPHLLSYVLRVRLNGISIVLGGDADEEVWDSIVGYYGKNLKCHVLKASHHGRDSGYHQEAVKLMSPKYTIVSVGKKPETDATNKYRAYSEEVWSTRWKGNITLTIDDVGRGRIMSQCNR